MTWKTAKKYRGGKLRGKPQAFISGGKKLLPRIAVPRPTINSASFFSEKTNIQLLRSKISIMEKSEGKLSEDDMISLVNGSVNEIWADSDVIVRGVGIPFYHISLDVFTDKGNNVVIKGAKRNFQSWSLNPAYGFYYSIGGGGNGFVIALNKSALKKEDHRLMKYGKIQKESGTMESGEYSFNVPWNFWRELEVRTKPEIEVPKRSITVFVQGMRLGRTFERIGLKVIYVKSLWTEREKLRKLIGVGLK